jgi:hypothetical protein
MKPKLITTKAGQIKAVARAVEDLFVAIQSHPNYFTDAETFEECHAAVAKIFVDRVKAGKVKHYQSTHFGKKGVKVSPMELEQVFYFIKDGFDLDLIRDNILPLATASDPELAKEVLDIDDDEDRADATSSHIDSNTFFNK